MAGRFTRLVVRVLREAGWSPERRVDTGEVEALLGDWGFPIHQADADVLTEFGGLDCRSGSTGSWLRFGVKEALRWTVPAQVPAFGRIIGQPLCPVGHGNGCVWLVGPQGEVVWLQDEWLGYVRVESLPSALDTHFRGDYKRTAWVGFEEAELRRLLSDPSPKGVRRDRPRK